MDSLSHQRPSESTISENPEIRKYILELESAVRNYMPYEKSYRELDTKYLDVQEDLYAATIQNNEYKLQIKALENENSKLRQENITLRNTIESLEQAIAEPQMERTDNDAPTARELQQAQNKSSRSSSSSSSVESVNDAAENINYANSILVKNVPKKLMPQEDTKKAILALAKCMNLQVTEMDISNAIIKERKFYERLNMQPKKLILIVEFRNQKTKVDFLKHKEKLKTNTSFKDIEITDYVSEDIYNLYQYAKVLKSHGYNSVYWRNNCVYVKKTRSTNSQPILIESQNQVDVLKSLK
uniref:Uncharacterized protein n=1 Tax=Stomoxys calcitrans TaxID=35570 RepID=A0A1I8Q5Y9_STOCA